MDNQDAYLESEYQEDIQKNYELQQLQADAAAETRKKHFDMQCDERNNSEMCESPKVYGRSIGDRIALENSDRVEESSLEHKEKLNEFLHSHVENVTDKYMPALSPEQREQIVEDEYNKIKVDDSSTIIGTPGEDFQNRFYQSDDLNTCDVICEKGIICKQKGIDVEESELMEMAVDRGWATSDGRIYERDMGKMLNEYGIATEQWATNSANIEAIKNELLNGNDVIVGVDLGVLYDNNSYKELGHAIRVTGIETNSDGEVSRVFVNDSNRHQAFMYDRGSFENAWNKFGNTMVSTKNNNLDWS